MGEEKRYEKGEEEEERERKDNSMDIMASNVISSRFKHGNKIV